MPLSLDLAGHVITPRFPDYDEARTVFAAVDRRPALIARAASPSDVAAAIAHAREHGQPLAVRSGGHSPAGHGVGDDGVVIDLSRMRGLEIDPKRRVAWAGAGLTAGAYTAWAAAVADELREGDDGAYAGFLGDEGPARVRAAYPGAHWGPPGGDQGRLRPRQRVPAQPEHRARARRGAARRVAAGGGPMRDRRGGRTRPRRPPAGRRC